MTTDDEQVKNGKDVFRFVSVSGAGLLGRMPSGGGGGHRIDRPSEIYICGVQEGLKAASEKISGTPLPARSPILIRLKSFIRVLFLNVLS